MNPSMPTLSVIVPTHNRPALLAEALASLVAQTCADWEAVVVDDASSPAVPTAQGDPRIRVVRQNPGQGGAAAKNRGIAEARGNVIAYLDDDDLYDPDYLTRALDLLERRADVDVVFMGVSWFGSNGAWGQDNYDRTMERFLAGAGGAREGDVSVFGEALLPALLRSVPMAFQRPVVRRAALDRIGGYRPDCLLWDCDWAIRAALASRAALIHSGLYRQRAEGQGYSSKQDRTLEHMHSGIDIMERLLQASRGGRHPEHLPLFRAAAARSWFDLAWHYYLNGRRAKVLSPLLRSALHKPGLAHLKLLSRLPLPVRPPVGH
ncbi:MAG: glycosyltransferase [Thiobacillus sp.]|nr:glycosyltransferase [Thiobacillus sp.]